MFSIQRWWKRNYSKEPWIEIVSQGVDSQGHVKMEFDWNQAFIDNLHRSGFTNADPEECVRAWFQALTNEKILNMIDEMERERKEASNNYIPAAGHPNLDKPGKIDQQ